jgi:hypothetical protein
MSGREAYRQRMENKNLLHAIMGSSTRRIFKDGRWQYAELEYDKAEERMDD